MNDLISRRALCDFALNQKDKTITPNDIMRFPAADIPVVKSYWTTKRTEQHDGEWYCANCGYEPIVFEGSRYCANCGAIMEEDEK